ncbi:MAG: transposase mutator type, partial [Candidatus Magnetoglobus multicellularis str. Araruama]
KKSILDLLQFDKKTSIEKILIMTFETILEAEQKGFLGYEYGDSKKNSSNKRNGYYKSRLLKGLSTMFRVKVPRDRQGLFKPMLLELLKEESGKINELSVKLYTKGLSNKEINEIVHYIYGKTVSRSTISNITNELLVEINKWRNRKIEKEYYAVYIDALKLSVRRDSVEKESFYIVLGLRTDLRREILGIYHIPEETSAGWEEAMKDLKERGLKNVLLFISDEIAGISKVIKKYYPKSEIQKCIVHKMRNITKKVRSKDKKKIMEDFKEVLSMDEVNNSVEKAVKRLDKFIEKWKIIYRNIDRLFENKKEYFSYTKFPYQMRRMIYTNNWIENLNKQNKEELLKIRNSFPK